MSKKYLKDYNHFSYKIDSILNEAYSFVKTLNLEPIKSGKFGQYTDKRITDDFLSIKDLVQEKRSIVNK
jgi:hypothetical protein